MGGMIRAAVANYYGESSYETESAVFLVGPVSRVRALPPGRTRACSSIDVVLPASVSLSTLPPFTIGLAQTNVGGARTIPSQSSGLAFTVVLRPAGAESFGDDALALGWHLSPRPRLSRRSTALGHRGLTRLWA